MQKSKPFASTLLLFMLLIFHPIWRANAQPGPQSELLEKVVQQAIAENAQHSINLSQVTVST